MGENKYNNIKLFGFELNQSSILILFFVSLTTLIAYISIIYEFIFDLIYIFPTPTNNELMAILLPFTLSIIPVMIYVYIIVISLKMKFFLNNKEIDGIKLFGFKIDKISTPILFVISIINLTIFPMIIFSYFLIPKILNYDFYGIHNYLGFILNISGFLIIIIISFYTIYKSLKIRKELRESRDFSTESKNKPSFFGFKLNKSATSILYVFSLTPIISLVIPFYISFSNIIKLQNNIDNQLLSLPGFIGIVSSLVVYLYTLFTCLKWRRYPRNKDINSVKIFNIEMNQTSATVLLFMSLMGLIGFLSIFYRFINLVINAGHILDITYLISTNLLADLIIVLIYIYVMYKCLKVKNSVR